MNITTHLSYIDDDPEEVCFGAFVAYDDMLCAKSRDNGEHWPEHPSRGHAYYGMVDGATLKSSCTTYGLKSARADKGKRK